ncbi:MAG: glutaminyl-tRNA synthase (glutamine-hydrolyzing) subunit B, partial [Gemmatimonadetes bacterium 21-71-4]
NRRAVEHVLATGLAIDAGIAPVTRWDRKNYFYPDLPKGYQISQFDQPLATGGVLAAGHRSVGITRVHMEEDAGKSIHDRFSGATAIDLNRAGVPLIEIVSEPDMRSAADAGAYLRALKQLLEYVDVSDVSMEEGSLRVDANISVRLHGSAEFGTKTEVKNMNSFSGVEHALETEFVRQCALVEAGGTVEQQTMLWDGAAAEVRPARSKEGSHDYRYFPEPDLPPLVLAPEHIGRIRDTLPELPAARRARYAEAFGLGAYDVKVLTASPRVAEYFEATVAAHGDAKAAANWVMGEVLGALKTSGGDIAGFPIDPPRLAALLGLVRDGVVSHTAAKRIFGIMLASLATYLLAAYPPRYVFLVGVLPA